MDADVLYPRTPAAHPPGPSPRLRCQMVSVSFRGDRGPGRQENPPRSAGNHPNFLEPTRPPGTCWKSENRTACARPTRRKGGRLSWHCASWVPLVALLGGCLSTMYFAEANLQGLSPGWSKPEFLTFFEHPRIQQPILRAAKRDSSGVVTEVFTLDLRSRNAGQVEYWFVFRNGVLEQWGRPEDWGDVSETYDINFNPAPRVSRP